MKISVAICINQFWRWKFLSHFVSGSFDVGNIRRHFWLTSLERWPSKFPWLFNLYCLSQILTLGVSIANLHCFGIRYSTNRGLSPSVKQEINLLQSKNIFDVSSHEFFPLQLMKYTLEFLAKWSMQKKKSFVGEMYFLLELITERQCSNFVRCLTSACIAVT